MSKVKPIFRVFDYDKAIEFYVNWLGFKIDWEHKPGNAPFYIQISLRDVTLNLSEHHGDACPGSHAGIDDFTDLREYHQVLLNKEYKYNRPGLETPEWGVHSITMTVIDPFGNRLTFGESI
jgi:catechol 2,3-dioxygenase-like lactoylglutathione lyase family enzyme